MQFLISEPSAHMKRSRGQERTTKKPVRRTYGVREFFVSAFRAFAVPWLVLIGTVSAIIAVLVVVEMIFFPDYVDYESAPCPKENVLVSETDAIAAAKELVRKHQLFGEPFTLGSAAFLKRLEENPRCCTADKLYEKPRFAGIWEVHFATTIPRYGARLRMDACGQRLFDTSAGMSN